MQVTLRPSIYAIATNLATEHGTFPGRIIERALLALVNTNKIRRVFPT